MQRTEQRQNNVEADFLYAKHSALLLARHSGAICRTVLVFLLRYA
jgi:hypothetical protein